MTHPRAHSLTNTQPLCKGVRKDGSPCQAKGHHDLDGYCIAHAPADKLHAWRVHGGSAATATLIDRRVPERFKDIIELLTEGMTAVRSGHLSPSAYNAICNGAKELRDDDKLADEEMEEIRAEEDHAAAAAMAGGHSDLNILNTALEPLRDPLTGQPMDRLPARARTGVVPETGEVETDPEVLADQVRQAEDLIRLLENLYRDDDYERTQDELHNPDAPNGAVINHQPVPTS